MSGSAFNAFRAWASIAWSPRLYITLVRGIPGTRRLLHRHPRGHAPPLLQPHRRPPHHPLPPRHAQPVAAPKPDEVVGELKIPEIRRRPVTSNGSEIPEIPRRPAVDSSRSARDPSRTLDPGDPAPPYVDPGDPASIRRQLEPIRISGISLEVSSLLPYGDPADPAADRPPVLSPLIAGRELGSGSLEGL